MVRIGEYSPLNIKLRPSGHIVMGLGEYEERKKLLLEQRKKEYCQYKEQALLMANNCQTLKKQLHAGEQKIENVKNVSTQTENLCQNERCIQQPQEVLTDLSIRSPSTMDSKMCLKKNELTPNQIKQFLYREELMKQISERQQIEAQKKLQEKLEEEAIEAKFKQQQMEIDKKYESEVEKKMQEALKKREQEEALHRHLIEMEKQTMQRKQQRCKNHVASPSRNNFEGSSKINKPRKDDYHEEFLKNPSINYPQVENNGIVEELNENEDLPSEQIVCLDSRCDNPKETKTICDNVLNNKRDVIRKKANVKSPKSTSPSRNNITSNSPSFTVLNYVDPISEMRQRHAEAEDILCMPLSEYSIDNSPASVPVQNDPLPPLSNIETKDFIQPTTRPKSPPIPAATTRARTISDKLHDKWLIPAVEKYVVTPIDIHSHNSRSVLTQLGAFRKHLQLEQMRMINNSSSGKKN
uniref:CCDC66 domain-containing protein n=1 Tax=Clastoptera arizonana TaxID=38151 RepID=A0A1B6CEK9_9HEMI